MYHIISYLRLINFVKKQSNTINEVNEVNSTNNNVCKRSVGVWYGIVGFNVPIDTL